MAEDKTKTPLDVWLGRITPLTAFATFVAVMLSIVHEYGYYLVVGQHFFSALTTTDILRAALLWLLPTLILFASSTAFIFLTNRAVDVVRRKIASNSERQSPDGQPAEALEGNDLEKQFAAIRRRELVNLWSAMCVLAVPTAAVAWFVSAVGGIAFLALIGASVFLASSFDSPGRSRQVVGYALQICFLLSAVFTVAQHRAYSSVRSTIPTHAVDLKEAGATREVVLLRSIDKGLVFRDPTRDRVELLRWEDVRAISQKTPLHRPGLRGYVCLHFGVACYDPLLAN